MMLASKLVDLQYKFHPNVADIEYLGAKSCEFSHSPALTPNPGYASVANI